MNRFLVARKHLVVLTIIGVAIYFIVDYFLIDPSNLIEYTKKGDLRRVRKIIDADPALANFKREDGVPLLYFAACNGHAKIVSLLLDHGAQVDAKGSSGSALHGAVDREKIDVVEILLRKNADVNITDDWLNTPLHNTTRNNSPSIAKMLIQSGADVNANDNVGRTPLHRCKNASIAKLLMEHGSDIHARDTMGYTPLHWPGTRREIIDRDTIILLIKMGANVMAKDNHGRTPKELALENEQFEFISILDTYVREK